MKIDFHALWRERKFIMRNSLENRFSCFMERTKFVMRNSLENRFFSCFTEGTSVPMSDFFGFNS